MLLTTAQQSHPINPSITSVDINVACLTITKCETQNRLEPEWDFTDSNSLRSPKPEWDCTDSDSSALSALQSPVSNYSITPTASFLSTNAFDSIVPLQSVTCANEDNEETVNVAGSESQIINDSQNIFNQYLCNTHECRNTNAEAELNEMTNDLLGLSIHEIAAAFDENLKSNLARTVANTGYTSFAMLSNIGFDSGSHEWSLRVLECDAYRQEIGVISLKCRQNTEIHLNGIKTTNAFGARAVYGFDYVRNISYYGSYNEDNTIRCFKDLSKCSEYHRQWKKGDIVKVCMDVDKCRIKFYVNGVKIRKTLSLEKGHMYYPILSFCYKNRQCQYELLTFL